MENHQQVKEGKYEFDDANIINLLEKQHINSAPKPARGEAIDVDEQLLQMTRNANNAQGTNIMNSNITTEEVKMTFGKCSGTSGEDGIYKDMIDKADRMAMTECLLYIYQSAWQNGEFINSWKLENRNVIPKADKDDYHAVNAYRTVSVTSIIGKRFEHISSKRLLVAIDSDNFDPNQYMLT